VSTRRRPPPREDEKRFLDEDDEIDNIVDYDEEMGEFLTNDW